jgi:ankyrin repeat protein
VNRLIDAILQANLETVAKILRQPSIDHILFAPWGDDHESALLLTFRLMNSSWEEKKRRAAWATILDLLNQAVQPLAVDKIPLPEAALSGRLDAVTWHLNHNPLSTTNLAEYEKATALAVRLGSCELTQQLLDAGVAVETRQQDTTLLMMACEIGSEPVVDLLLSRRADPNAQMTERPTTGMTVLMFAAKQKNVKILEKLIAAGADHRTIGPSNHSVRDYAQHKKVLAYLDALATAQNHTSLHEAIAGNSLNNVRHFLVSGAALDTLDSLGNTPLLLALKMGNPKVIQLLVDAGASLDEKELWPAALSARSGKSVAEVVSQLIAVGVDVNRRDSQGLPPLFRSGDPVVMQLLLDAGADPHFLYVQPVDFQDIKFQAIHLSTAHLVSKKKQSKGKESSWAEIEAELIASNEMMNIGMAVAEFFKDKDASFFETSQNRTEENARYFELYERGKVEAAATVSRYSAIDYYKMWGNRKAGQFLRDYLGMTKDAYDLATAEVKEFGKRTDEGFLEEAERLADILQSKPVPWKKRKGVLHFTTALHKTLPSYFQEDSKSAKLDRVDGFEEELLSRLQAEVRGKGFTLIWTERHWNQRPLTRLLLIPSKNDLTALAICGTNRNTGDDSREVVNWCDRIRKTIPFQIAGSSFDSMELEFEKPLSASLELAREIAAFCPEVEVPLSDEAALAEMARELETTCRCFFWWD